MPQNDDERSSMSTLLTILSVAIGSVIVVGSIIMFKFMSMIA